MPLERFIPKSPDMFIRNSQDFEVAKFGHLNTIVEYINNNTVLPAGLNGYVQFNDNNALGGDPGLFWDNVNKRLGVGTVIPGATLEIYGGANTLGISGPANQAKSIQIARYNNSSFQSHYIGDDGGAFFGIGLTISASGSGSQIYLQVSTSGRNVNIGSAGQTLLPTDLGARLGVRGSGSTAATTSLLVQNSAGAAMFSIKDNSVSLFTGFVTNYGGGSITSNTAFGSNALGLNSTGANNTAFGLSASYNNSTGSNNTSVGYLALALNSASNNTAIGYRTLSANTSGSLNVAVGVDALLSNAVGSNNTAIGYQSLNSNTASNNTAVGYQAGYSNTTGTENTSLGYIALKATTSGNYNVGLGAYALNVNTTGQANVSVGNGSLELNISGGNNVAIGHQSLKLNTASSNTAIGFNAGNTITTGAGNLCLGYQAVPSSATASNEISFGSSSVNAGSVTIGVLAQTSYWNVRINGTAYRLLIG